MRFRLLSVSRLPLGLLILASGIVATALTSESLQAQSPKYPRINTAIAYVVDPHWPKKPATMKWADMPGVTVDAQDRVYVFTRTDTPVQVYDAEGNFIRSWGQEHIKSAHHIRVDHEGSVWTSDIGNHTVQKFTPEGKLLLTIGTKGVEGRDQTHMNRPTDMAITPSGDVFVSDGYGNARVVHFDKNGKFVKDWGELGAKPGQFSIPHSIAVDSKGRLYVADRNNVRIQVFDQSGKLLDVWNNLLVPWGLWITKNDEIWACGSSPAQWQADQSNLGVPPKDQILMKFNPEGKLLQLWTVPKGADGLEKPGELNWVHCIAVDSKGNLYAGDIKGKRAQKFIRQN